MRDRDHALLQPGDRFRYLPRRTRRIAPLYRAVKERPLFVLPIGSDLFSAFARFAALHKNIRVKGRQRRHREYFAVVRVERNDGSALRRRRAKFLFGRDLHVQVDGRDKVLARLRFDAVDLALDAAAAIDDHLSIAGFAAKIFVVIFLTPTFADDIARTHSAFDIFFLFQLFRADLADVAEHVRKRFAERIETLRLAFDREFGKFERVRFDPRDVLHRGVLFQYLILKIVLLFAQRKAFINVFGF